MQITQKFLEEECRKMKNLLSAVEVKAEIIGSDDDIYIALTDIQGAPLNDIETTRFHCAAEVIDALNVYFEGIYLNGNICCDADHDFENFKEAEEYARKAGYTAEADNIKTLLDILEEEKSWIIFSDDHIGYILPRKEADAAHRYIEYLGRREDMEAALHRLVYGGYPDDPDYVDIFEDEYGISAEEALGLTDRATDNFFAHFTVDEPEYDQMDYWAAKTVSQYAEEEAQKRKSSCDDEPIAIAYYFANVADGHFASGKLSEVLRFCNFEGCRNALPRNIGIAFSNGDELVISSDGKVDDRFYENANQYSNVCSFKEATQEIFWSVLGVDEEENKVALGA